MHGGVKCSYGNYAHRKLIRESMTLKFCLTACTEVDVCTCSFAVDCKQTMVATVYIRKLNPTQQGDMAEHPGFGNIANSAYLTC